MTCHWQQWQPGVVSLSLFIMITPKLIFTFAFAALRPGQEEKSNYGLVLAIFSAFMVNLHYDPKLEGLSLTRMTPLSS
jgi:hypothetical protein